MLVAGAPYIFTDGTPSRLLTCPITALNSTLDCIDFSNDSGATWTYAPNGAYDAADTNIRFTLTGTMAVNVGAGSPSFSLKFNVQVK